MEDLFNYENEDYLIFQRSYFSNIFIYNKGKKIQQIIDPVFFINILKAPIDDTDMVLIFPWKVDLEESRIGKRYIEGYKIYWNVSEV